MPFRSFSADDIFISYTRLDASTYAAGLADELTKKGFSCFIDKLGTVPNKELPDMLRRKIKSCAMLVIVGTERASTRQIIEDEIKEFLQTGRNSSIVPIDFDGAVYKASWYSLVEGIAPEPETDPAALSNGNPSPSVLNRIEKQFNYSRRNQRLRRATLGAASLLLLLLLAGVGAGVYAAWQIRLAAAARAEAERERSAAATATAIANDARRDADAATAEARVAEAEAERAKIEAAEQRKVANEATKEAEAKTRLANEASRRASTAEAQARAAQTEAERQQTLADSRSLANRSQTLLRQRPNELPRSVTLAVDALKKSRTVEADTALRASLSLLPRLYDSEIYEGDITQTALSPDGRHFAALDSEKHLLRIYESGSQTKLAEISCDGNLVALSNDAAHAAIVSTSKKNRFEVTEPDIKIINRITGSSHTFKGAAAMDFKKITMSPGGKYVAIVYSDWGVRIKPSWMQVVETTSGKVIKEFKDKSMQVNDVTFGPLGDLALGGRRIVPGGFEVGYAVLWRLAGRLAEIEKGESTESPALSESDFSYSVNVHLGGNIYAEGDLDAIAPGAEFGIFATNKGVWRTAGSSQQEAVAIIPRGSQIRRLAFNRDGTRLLLVRDDSPVSLLEVWDAAGYANAADGYMPYTVQDLTFAPDDQSVSTATHTDALPAMLVYPDNDVDEVLDKVTDDTWPGWKRAGVISSDVAFVIINGDGTASVRYVWRAQEFSVSYIPYLKRLSAAAASTDGRFLVLAGPSATGQGHAAVIYRSAEGSFDKGTPVMLKDSEPIKIGLTSDGRLLTIINGDSTAQVWNVSNGQEVTPAGLKNLKTVGSLKLSPEGRFLAAVNGIEQSEPGSVHVWRLADGQGFDPLTHAGAVQSYVFSPDGRQLLVAGSDYGMTRLLDLSTGRASRVFNGMLVTAAAFSSDGRYLGVGLRSGDLKVFMTSDLENEIFDTKLYGEITAVAFSYDSRRVAAAATSRYFSNEERPHRLGVWLLQPEDLLAEASARLAKLPAYARSPK